VAAGVLYSPIRLLLDVATTSRQEQAKLQAEVLVLRRQVQVLERQIKRVRWTPADRMILAALRERLPRSAWGAPLVRPETVLGCIATSSTGNGRRTDSGHGVDGLSSRRNAASLREYVDHYNEERPHRSRDLRTPSGGGDPTPGGGTDSVKRSFRLGGLLSHYHVDLRAA
jgi:hypothetical protein